MSGPLLLVGCGKMGGSLLRGWLAQGVAAADVHVVEPTPLGLEDASVPVVGEPGSLDPALKPAIVVFAVKPQVMDGVAPAFGRYRGPGTVFLSIAAGTTIGSFADRLGPGAAVVRAMPNTPAAVGRGFTALCANAAVTPGQRDACGMLMQAVGEIAWLEDERLMDVVTAVSGSGPAYVFLLVETLAKAGEAEGLPEELAMRLARATVAGSGELLHRSSEPAAELRGNVTSPGGTTAAALEVLAADPGLAELMKAAVRSAAKRSRELAD